MQEKKRGQRESLGGGPSALDDLFPATDGAAMVTVCHGHYSEQLPVNGMSVAEIRSRYRDRFDIDPAGHAFLDARQVSDDTIVRAGQMLVFQRPSGEKGSDPEDWIGAPRRLRDFFGILSSGAEGAAAATAARADPIPVTIAGDVVRVRTPEGTEATIGLADLVARLAPPRMDTRDVILPDGVKAVLTRGHIMIWVHQTPPRTFAFKWIAADSPEKHGRGTKYRTVRVALPYVVLFAVFLVGWSGETELSHANECFFRNAPLRSLDDDLCFPALLNCSRFEQPDERPLSWICTQYLHHASYNTEKDPNERQRRALKALLRCLFETGFNYSSEAHEASSWFTESTRVDRRIATIEAWEAATRADQMFALDVPWISAGRTVRQIAERIFDLHEATERRYATSNAIARLVINAAGRKAK